MKPLICIRNFIIFGLSALILVFFTGTISNDFMQYQLIFDQITTSEGPIDAILKYRYEPGFIMLYYYLSEFFSANNTFFVIAFFILTIKYLLFLKYLKYPVTAWFLYTILFMPVLDASQLRTAIASTIIIYLLFTSSSKAGYIFKALAASMFHYIALIIIAFQSYKKPIFTLLITLSLALLLDNILRLVGGDIFKVATFLSSTNSENQNVTYMNIISVPQLFLSLYCIINWKGFNDVQKKGGLLIMLGILLYFALGHNPGIAHRIREVSLLGIFPLFFSIKVNFNYNSMLAYSSLFIIVSYHFVYIIDELINL